MKAQKAACLLRQISTLSLDMLGSCGSFEGCAWSDGIVFARERIGVYDPHMIHDDSACLEMMIFFTGLGLGLGLPEILMKYFAST